MIRLQIKQIASFVVLVTFIYTCYLTSAVYHEKILKHPYQNKNESFDIMNYALSLTFYPSLVASIIGFFITSIQKQCVKIPSKKCAIIGLLLIFNQFTYNQAVVYASFPSIVMAKSCSLLSVILVAVFCSKVKDKKLKLGPQKIIIGIMACLGIFFFNFFANNNEEDGVNHPLSSISLFLLIISLIGDGFLPDFQAQIKANYKPSSYDMYYNINKWAFLISTIILLVKVELFDIIMFPLNHPQYAKDIFLFSFINGIGQLFIYELIKKFKQHIPAFVIAIRKCVTVIINIVWFGHQINVVQLIGLIIVFAAVMAEVYSNNCVKKSQQKSPQTKQIDQDQLPIIQQEQDNNDINNQDDLLEKIDDQIKNLIKINKNQDFKKYSENSVSTNQANSPCQSEDSANQQQGNIKQQKKQQYQDVEYQFNKQLVQFDQKQNQKHILVL